MIGRRQEINLQLTELLDSGLLAFFLWFGYYLRADFGPWIWPGIDSVPPFSDSIWLLSVIAPFTPIVLEARGFYGNLLNKSGGVLLRQLVESFVIIGMIVGALSIFLRWEVPSRAVLMLGVGMGALALLARTQCQKEILRRKLKSGQGKERVIVAGAAEDVERLISTFTEQQKAEIDVCEKIDLVAQPVSEIVAAMHRHAVSRVLLAAQHIHFARVEEAVQACETEGVEAWIVADFFQTAIARPTFNTLGGKLMLVFHSTPQASWELLCKSVLDRVGAFVILVLSLPLWLLAAVGIGLSSRGPIFFRQERAGRYGKSFMMWKFRTMHSNAEQMRAELEQQNEMDGPVFKIKKDPRVFAFGAWLRRMSIDELPQLVNVLRGEMSLVGPRPLPVYEVQKIEKSAQRRRLSVRPGLTCLWQVSGRNGITNFDEWVELDLKYIDHWSLWLYLKILLKTFPDVLRGAGAS
jgi:exopolysaccharide biosynthesis polyprenyl glycosylphosphotransferase